MIREFCDEFNVLIPYRALSGARLISIGADNIIMGKKAELGPIDPTLGRKKDQNKPWEGNLSIFKNSEKLIDEIFNTSMIYPVQITSEDFNLETLSNSISKEILRSAINLSESSEDKIFFISPLIDEATSKLKTDIGNLYTGIVELKSKKILIPVVEDEKE